jgi:hypothetical protein
MKAFILYHPKSDHTGAVEDFAHEFQRFNHKNVELVSLESIEGAQNAELYDVTVYPALLVVRDDSQMIKIWQGNLPQKNELEAFL